MKNKVQNRFIVKNVEIRKSENGEGEEKTEQRFVSGLGAVFGVEQKIWDGFYETIRAGAFDDSLKSGDVIKSYFNHDANQVLATTSSTPKLELKSDSEGLHFEAPIPPTTYGEDLTVNLERGNVAGASFSFTIDEDIMIIDEEDNYRREIVKATLYEVGPVTNPAYEMAEVGLRDKDSSMEEFRARIEKQKDEERSDKGSSLDLYKLNLSISENS